MTQQTFFDQRATSRPDGPCLAWEKSIEPGPGCSVCGSLEEWQDAIGRLRCGACEADVLGKARRFAETAAQLRT